MNVVISVLKGIGIILVVLGHSDIIPDNNNIIWQVFYKFIYSFHMPLFLMASGFFFKDSYLDNKISFVKKKIGGVYLRFVKWSLIFLLLHNLFFFMGIINENYGWFGTGTHLYDLNTIVKDSINILFRMDHYDGFLLGVFWFMRVLFVSSLLLCFVSYIFSKIIKNKEISICLASILFVILCIFLIVLDEKLPQYLTNLKREMIGTCFIGVGYMFGKASIGNYIRNNNVFFLSSVILSLCLIFYPKNMGHLQDAKDVLSILISGVTGFIFVYNISFLISKKTNSLRNMLIYVGNNSFYVMTFHMLMFKPLSYLKTCMYGLEIDMIGCVPVIDEFNNIVWILLYTTSSIVFSLLLGSICEKSKYLRNSYRPSFLRTM